MPKLDHGVEDNEHDHGFGYGKVGHVNSLCLHPAHGGLVVHPLLVPM
jgi:hypothetical protein